MQQPHDVLAARWHEQLDRVTDLSLRLHSLDETDPTYPVRSAAYEAELVVARQALSAIESELAQLPPARVPS